MQTTTVTLSKKSGKGITDGVISELTAFFGVKPGCTEQLRQAITRFDDMLHNLDPKANEKIGLRDSRMVLFDNGTRMLWTTTFETDWDPYLDDALLIVGVQHFMDWMKYVTEAETLTSWVVSAGGADILSDTNSPEFLEVVQKNSSGLKAIIQSVQIPATGYWNALAATTIPEIRKAQRVETAFQQVLDNPEAAEALQHPALQPLLEEAAD
ncbi:MAG: hypothetical protein FOGNACKC_01215 [Anaerolineae bacterium]|mgnify:CR=1 FL=1|nr:hypothetical protein [Anaerolineae bacterium]